MPPSPNFPPVIAASPRPCLGPKLNAPTDNTPAYVASSAYTPLHGLVSSAKAATPTTAAVMRRAASHRPSVGSLDGSTVIDIFPNIRITTPAVDHSQVFVFPNKAYAVSPLMAMAALATAAPGLLIDEVENCAGSNPGST